MKTPRRKYYNTQRDESDVCSRELGPLEIGELETPKERRSAPVAAVRYLAGSKFHSNSPEESEYTENSDYTDARSENSEDFVDSYKSDVPKYQFKRPSRRYGELRQESQDREQGGHHQPSRGNFAREFKLKYGSNITSNLQYYHTSNAMQDTFFHNMDYIHSQFTNFNPNFINFNYGHFSYPNYGLLKNRPGEYYNAQNPAMYTSIHHRPMPEYGYHRPENMLPLNHDYYSRYDPQYMRAHPNYTPLSQGYMRGPESNRSSNMLGDYTPISQNRYHEGAQQYQCSRHDCNSSHHDSSYDHRRARREHSLQNDSQEYHHVHKREDRENHRGQDYSRSELNRKDEETMKLAIEKAVKNALDSYITTNKLKVGDETCYTDPAPGNLAIEKSDETLTSRQQEQIYGDSYAKRYKEEFKEYSKEHQYIGNEFMIQKDHHYTRSVDYGYSVKDQSYNSNNPRYYGKDYDFVVNNHECSPESNNVQYHTADCNYGKGRYEVQERRQSPEYDTKEITAFDITKLRNEIQKVMDDVDSLTNELNESDVKPLAKYEHDKPESNKKENEDARMNNLYMSQVTDYNDLGGNNYDYLDLFITKSTTLYDLQTNKMKESQSLGETFRYGIEEEYGNSESMKKEMAERQASKGMLKHVDLFNNDDESHHDQSMEERLTNRDDEQEDDDSVIMGGSTYEVEANMENTGYYQGSQYQDTSYYPSSSFNLNTFNSFSCLISSSSKMDMKDEEGENINGTTLSTSDLIESRTNLQINNDDYNGGHSSPVYSVQGGDDANRNTNVADGNYSSGYDNNRDGDKGEDGNDNISSTNAPNDYGEVSVKCDLLNHLNGQHNDDDNNGLQNNGKKQGRKYSTSPKVESERVDDENENPFLNKTVIKNGKEKENKLESDDGLFKVENNESTLSKTGESDEEMVETYTQSRQNESEPTSGLRGSYAGPLYQSQAQNGKITSEHQKNESTKNNSNYSISKRSHPRNIDGVSHICSRIEQLEESLKRIETHLNSKPEEKNETRKSLEFKLERTKAKPPSTNTQMDQVSEMELMEGYKAAAMIKKLLHVKSMDSLIPAFTAFVRNRMA
ncbi:hypothetical protein MACJ_001116 [Theileria orientalis]|uniref:Uncharacterized protein n=1 Tax=Theileria orientalis TaxID=68886 RepID=A0A976M9H6_THEOR|nr:hypothetical protein MACJ_001116 [Theileria orientalis]